MVEKDEILLNEKFMGKSIQTLSITGAWIASKKNETET